MLKQLFEWDKSPTFAPFSDKNNEKESYEKI